MPQPTQVVLHVDVMQLLGLPRRGLLTIEEAGGVLGIGRTTAYRWANCGSLPTREFGSQRMVPVFELLQLLGAQVVEPLATPAGDKPSAPDGGTGALGRVSGSGARDHGGA